jgi:hypothetical protein
LEILIFLTPRRQDAKNGGTPDSNLPHAKGAKDAKDGEHTRLACGFRRPAESISDLSLQRLRAGWRE